MKDIIEFGDLREAVQSRDFQSAFEIGRALGNDLAIPAYSYIQDHLGADLVAQFVRDIADCADLKVGCRSERKWAITDGLSYIGYVNITKATDGVFLSIGKQGLNRRRCIGDICIVIDSSDFMSLRGAGDFIEIAEVKRDGFTITAHGSLVATVTRPRPMSSPIILDVLSAFFHGESCSYGLRPF